MTIRDTLKKYKDVEIELLLAHVLKQPKEFLFLKPNYELRIGELANLKKLTARRRKGEPIAYIVGYKYFYGLKFKVNKHVLVPRPETEWLVDRALEVISDKCKVTSKETFNTSRSRLSILDLGTGSGCIAVSVAHSLVTRNLSLVTRVSASDISPTALKVAQSNAKTHNVNIKFVQSDLFKNIQGKFDIVIANLPYVPQGMYELLYTHLKYEPKVAITDGGEAWDTYRAFFQSLPGHLKAKGIALLEIDDGSKPALQKMLKQLLPRYKATFFKDPGNRWRYLELRKM